MQRNSVSGGSVQTKRAQFVKNVLWNWSHVGISLFAAFLLSPYIIQKLGAEAYGVWSLVFSLVAYTDLLDFGFRAAMVYYSAQYRAKGEYAQIGQLASTMIIYSTVAALAVAVLATALASPVTGLMNLSAGFEDTFSTLVILLGVNMGLLLVSNVFSGLIEGFQRFDMVNQIRIIAFMVRYLGYVVLLAWGYGLLEMGALTLATQGAMLVMLAVGARRVFPGLRFCRNDVTLPVLRKMSGYGSHTFVSRLATLLQLQAPAVLIGISQPAAFVGFFNLPFRLLHYTADAVSRVGPVVGPRATELAATGQYRAVEKLGVYSNRYCLTLYLPLCILLLVYGQEIFEAWLGAEFAQHSAPLLPMFLALEAIAVAGQFTSSSILFGLNQHRNFAYAFLAESLLSALLMVQVIPHYGITSAAVVSAAFGILVRGLVTPWLLCRHLQLSFVSYMHSIFARPVFTALPLVAALAWSKQHWQFHEMPELLAVCVVVSALYLGIAYFTCLQAEHRSLLQGWAIARVRRESARA